MSEMSLTDVIPQKPLSELVAALGRAREVSSNLYDTYKEARSIEDRLRHELELGLREAGLKSIKGESYNASIAQKPYIVIQHEQSIIDWLENAPDIESDRYIGLKTTEFQSLAKSILNGTGEVIPGTSVEVRESLAIRSNKKVAQKIQG